MSHFITLVFTKENGKSVEELLAPFDEILNMLHMLSIQENRQ